MAEILTFPGSGNDCNSYLIIDEKVVLIDTGTGASPALKKKVEETGREVDTIINTHAHLDHVGGDSLFRAPVAIHEMDRSELEEGGLYGTKWFFGREAQSNVDTVLRDGDIIETGEITLNVIHTPGHTPGSICLLSNRGHLFSGDTLFSGGSFGRTDLPGGSTPELISSLERLKNLEFEFLMPGHMGCVAKGKSHLALALNLLGEMYEGI